MGRLSGDFYHGITEVKNGGPTCLIRERVLFGYSIELGVIPGDMYGEREPCYVCEGERERE